jgi:glycosyltransferase involved in cell wall biosynthesis
LKVAQVCARYFPYIGGVETHVMMISQWMKSQSIDLEILTTDPSGKLPPISFVDGIKIHRFPSFAPAEAYYFSPGLHSFLRKHSNEYDVVHAHSYHSFPALYAALTKRSKFVFTPHYHGTGHTPLRRLLHVPFKSLGKICFEKADWIICVSNFERNLVAKNFNKTEQKITIIPNGIVANEFVVSSRGRLPVRKILCVGRLERYKRIDCVINSIPYLSHDVQLQIVGSGPDKHRLPKLVNKLGLEDRVTFIEGLDRKELLQKFSDASVFVLLSEHEAYGMTVMEALAAGTPCVVANTSALSEFVDNKNCFGIDNPENPEEVANFISKALENEVRDFKAQSWEQIAENTLSVYERVMTKEKLLWY